MDIINSSYFYLDLWSFVHILTGFLIMLILVKYKVFNNQRRRQFLVVFALEAVWESLEWTFYSRGIFFAVNSAVNICSDFMMNLIGAWLYLKFSKK